MNYITHLTIFFERASSDTRLNTTHISMYMSLFQFWNFNRFKNPISISRSEVMKISKISAIATYHKCIKELNAFGYIIYEPSYNPFKGSVVKMLNFENGRIPTTKDHTVKQTSHEQALDKHPTTVVLKNEQVRDSLQTSSEQALVPYINNTKPNKHNKQYCVATPKTILKFEQVKIKETQKRKVAPKEKTFSNVSSTVSFNKIPDISSEERNPSFEIPPRTVISSVARNPKLFSVISHEARNLHTAYNQQSKTVLEPFQNSHRSLSEAEVQSLSNVEVHFQKPHLSDVQLYFAEKDAQIEEAEKFFNHYESNGWLVGGKSKMKNWQAAARNWLLNTKKFNSKNIVSLSGVEGSHNNLQSTTKNNHLNAFINKSYQEPL